MSELSNKAIYQLIERASSSEGWIKEIRFSDFWIAEDKDNSYPLLVIDVLGGGYTDIPRRRSFEIQLTLFDQRRDDNLNFQDAVSSTRNVLEDIVVRLRSAPYSSAYGVRFISDPSSRVIKWGDSNDKLIGTQMNFEISVPSTVCASSLPPVVGSPSIILPECDSVVSNVFSQNGTLLNSGSTSFPSQFNYTVPSLTITTEAPAQIVTIDASVVNYELESIVWANSEGKYISSYLPVHYSGTMYADDVVVVNSNGGEQATLPLSGTVHFPFSASPVNFEVYNSVDDQLTAITSSITSEYYVPNSTINLVPNGGEYIVSTTEIPATQSDNLVIPDFNIINSNGQSATSVSYSGNVHVDFSADTSAIIYQRPINTQRDSYDESGTLDNSRASYDEGWHLRNGTYDYVPPASGTLARLDLTDQNPYTALTTTNAFGNHYRFTNTAGTQDYSSQYVIDHLTGLGFYTQSEYDASFGGGNWAGQLSAATASNRFGYSDWRVASWNEWQSILPLYGSGYDVPFSNFSTVAVCSTTDATDLDNYITNFVGKHFYKAPKTNTARRFILVRNHYS